MIDVVFRVDALDPWDNDTYEIGTFADEKKAEYAKRKYEYTTDTGYPKAVITPIYLNDENHYLLDKDDKNGCNRIGYFAVLDDDGKFVMYRDKIAFNDRIISCYDIEMDNLIGKFNYLENSAVETKDEDINLLYTEVPYSETDTQMETEASEKFLKYLHDKK